MIAPMKKVSIVLLDNDKQNSLMDLKKLGVMHLSENFGLNEDVKAIGEQIKEVETALKFTEEAAADHSKEFDESEVLDKIKSINFLGKELSELEDNVSKYSRNIEFLEPWGEFNPSDLKLLDEKGIKITLIEASKEQFKHLPAEMEYFQIDQNKLGHLLAVIGKLNGNYVTFEPPELGIEDTLRTIDIIKDDIDQKQEKLEELSLYHGKILTYKQLLEDRFEFEKVKAGMGFDEKFSVLEGWIATDKVEKFKKRSSKNGWGIALSDPVEGDETPTLLRGNKLTSLIHPLLDFLGNVPGYWEQDVSSYFLAFFTIFFAMIIGDAGYGLLFIVFTLIAQLKMKKFNNVLALFYLISSATVVWGAITGNWFGSNLIKGIPFFKGFVLAQLDTDREIMELCFHIAVIHISLARIAAFTKDFKNKVLSGYTHLGWLVMTLGLLFVVKNLVISSTDYPIPTYSLIAIAIGFVVVILFGNQEKGKNFFKCVGMSLAFSPLTALDTVGAFGDIISYVRLYAVGLAGLAVAQSFNGMAAPLLESGGAGYFFGGLILLGGHGFNIAMAALSVLVHGVRLNVLEFSSAADVNWSGSKFNPFREKEII